VSRLCQARGSEGGPNHPPCQHRSGCTWAMWGTPSSGTTSTACWGPGLGGRCGSADVHKHKVKCCNGRAIKGKYDACCLHIDMSHLVLFTACQKPPCMCLQALHAAELAIDHPVTSERMHFSGATPLGSVVFRYWHVHFLLFLQQAFCNTNRALLVYAAPPLEDFRSAMEALGLQSQLDT
jgi:hypothetical protein